MRTALRAILGPRKSTAAGAPSDAPAAASPGEDAQGVASYGAMWQPETISEAMDLVLNVTDPEVFDAAGRRDAETILGPLIKPTDTVLDLGCGVGRVALHVAPRCRTLWAVDASPRMLELASNRLAGIQNVRFALCEGATIPSLRSESIDVAYSILTLQHVEREDAFALLRELARVVVPGGTVYLTFPNLLSDQYLAGFIAYVDRGEVGNPARARFYTPEEVARILPAAGFEIERLEPAVEIAVTCRRV